MSIAFKSPIVAELVYMVIKHKNSRELYSREKHRIDTNLVPNVNSLYASNANKMEESLASNFQIKTRVIRRPVPQGYGRLSPLILDSSVRYIECSGANIPILIVRRGQKQPTGISLSEGEIKSLFNYISEKSKIPITEGVFKVAVDNNLFNAVISDSIGTKFIIKKDIDISQQNAENNF